MVLSLVHFITSLQNFCFLSWQLWKFYSPEGKASTRAQSNGPTDLEAEIATGHFGFLMPLNQQAKKGLIYWLE